MHTSHEDHTARTELGNLIPFCSARGANGSEKAVLLKERCQPNTRCKRLAQWAAINEKRVHPASRLPLSEYRKVDKGRACVLGKPPQELCEEEQQSTPEQGVGESEAGPNLA